MNHKMNGKDLIAIGNSTHILYDQIRRVLLDAQRSVSHAVNTAMIHAYFELGRLIVEDEQHGETRAGYGEEILMGLSRKLISEFGKGFSVRNLRNMRTFYLTFKNRQTLSAKLSWSHYTLVMRLDNEQARSFHMKEKETENWSVMEVE